MTDVPKWLAGNLSVHTSVTVSRIEPRADHWVAQCESGETYSGRKLVITAPLPQALALLSDGILPADDPNAPAAARLPGP